MGRKTVFIDGAEGTTGLRIESRLAAREEIDVRTLQGEQRKDLAARVRAACAADVTVLCLPDAAAREVVAALPPTARVCDASTAHRTAPGWVYGFAELAGRRAQIAGAQRVAVPGCHATGFLALAAPLVERGLLAADALLVCHSVTGYTGGGKNMIAAYEAESRPGALEAPRQYALGLQHKHLPEMQAVAGLTAPPLFCPIVADYPCGMLVSLPLAAYQVQGASPQAVAALLAEYYEGEALITVHPPGNEPADGFLDAAAMAGRDALEIFVSGNAGQVLLCARFDNLGKGACGAALQCLNLMLGLPERAGLQP